MIRDAKYRAKLAFRGRDHAALVQRIGGVYADIDERLARRDTVRVLELGCGYGTVLLELGHRYGARVETFGVNREHNDGNTDIFVRNGMERGLIPPGGTAPFALPTIACGDIGDGLPFDEGSFDIVFSQVAWRYFPNKVFVLREVSRVLREDGLAKIDAEELRPNLPAEYQRLVEIWQDGKLVPFGDYARGFGMAFAPSAEGEYLRFAKSPLFGADLRQIMQIDLASLEARWDGIKCVYRIDT
jgi:SAM-dependent methyltransferase